MKKEEPKQETLEEAKLRQLFKNRSNCYADSDNIVQAMDENCFIETINEWQQERIYSEEEVLELLNKREDYINSVDDFFEYQSNEKWFEQNKKKV